MEDSQEMYHTVDELLTVIWKKDKFKFTSEFQYMYRNLFGILTYNFIGPFELISDNDAEQTFRPCQLNYEERSSHNYILLKCMIDKSPKLFLESKISWNRFAIVLYYAKYNKIFSIFNDIVMSGSDKIRELTNPFLYMILSRYCVGETKNLTDAFINQYRWVNKNHNYDYVLIKGLIMTIYESNDIDTIKKIYQIIVKYITWHEITLNKYKREIKPLIKEEIFEELTKQLTTYDTEKDSEEEMINIYHCGRIDYIKNCGNRVSGPRELGSSTSNVMVDMYLYVKHCFNFFEWIYLPQKHNIVNDYFAIFEPAEMILLATRIESQEAMDYIFSKVIINQVDEFIENELSKNSDTTFKMTFTFVDTCITKFPSLYDKLVFLFMGTGTTHVSLYFPDSIIDDILRAVRVCKKID